MCIPEVFEGELGQQWGVWAEEGEWRPVRKGIAPVLGGNTRAVSGGARFLKHLGNRGDRICFQVNVDIWSRKS